MTYDEITDIAYEVVSELEPAYSFDVFDVTDSHILFQDDRGLFKVCLDCLDSSGSLKDQLKASLRNR
jgi:hypothetical protein